MIDGRQIWQSILNDPDCMVEIPEADQQEIMRQYVERRLLIVLGELIDAPATAANVFRARIAHATAFLLEGWAQRILEESSKCRDNPWLRNFLLFQLQLRSYAMFERLIPLQNDIWKFVLMSGAADRVHLYDLGVDAENIWKCVHGEMTVGELFVAQPYIFLKLYSVS